MILKTIKKNHPQSIYELAKMIHRDRKNTFDDVQFLAQEPSKFPRFY